MHQGKLFSKLLDERAVNQTEFAAQIKKSRQYVNKAINSDEVPQLIINFLVENWGIERSLFDRPDCADQLEEKKEEVDRLLRKIVELQELLLQEKDEKSHLAMECVKLQHEVQVLTGKNLVEAFQVLAAEHPEIYNLRQG